MKKVLAAILTGFIIMTSSQVTPYADNVVSSVSDTEEVKGVGVEEGNTQGIGEEKKIEKIITSGIEDLEVQLNNLYKDVGKHLNIDYMYVKILHLLAGGKAIYADKRPNINVEETVNHINGPFEIGGSNQIFNRKADWIHCPDTGIQRPNKYYMPDAAYNVAYDIVSIMNSRYREYRGDMQVYFDSLKQEVKTNILFNEAILIYTGSDINAVNSFYSIYEKILYDKDVLENVIEMDDAGEFSIKDKFKDIFIDNGISSDRELEILALTLSFDRRLAISNNPDHIKEEYMLPYKVGYTSRENMMAASMSLVGGVRYVWGGGHLSSGRIKGINPAWEEFFDAYGKEEGEEGYGKCIKPKDSWCPIHGESHRGDGCIAVSTIISTVDEYISGRIGVFKAKSIEDEKFKSLIESDVNLEGGVIAHRLDGLDCSGYASWLFNQIDSTRIYDSGATDFIRAGKLRSVEYGSEMLPGDVFSWGSHIVVVVGRSEYGDRAYVMVESAPNMVKFGVIYYNGATQIEIDNAVKLAVEANELIGGIRLEESTHVHNMGRLGYREDGSRYVGIGRLGIPFIDEDTVLPLEDKKMKDMNAREVIQYTIKRLPEYYIRGSNSYDGLKFDTCRID